MRNEAMVTPRDAGLNWPVILFMGIFHAGAVAALFMFSWQALAIAIFLYWVAGSWGIGMAYHRLLTHRGYKVPKPVEYFLTICGTLAVEGGPVSWVAMHRLHHANTDREGDPHSPRDGRWWSHMGWILAGHSMHRNAIISARYAPDLAKDRFHVWLTKWHFVTFVSVGIALYALGGWAFVCWGIFFRTVFSWHATWFVNSAAHIWGKRRFEVSDDSRNNWWVALLSFGEGWHNNHHAHPTAARHGLTWYEIDINWYGIRALQLLGLAKNIKLIKLDKQAAKPAASGPADLDLVPSVTQDAA